MVAKAVRHLNRQATVGEKMPTPSSGNPYVQNIGITVAGSLDVNTIIHYIYILGF